MADENMKISMADGDMLKDSISLISDLINETNLHVKKDGLEIVAMDPANVAMVVLKLKIGMFTEYDAGNEFSIGLNLSNLKQILKRMKSKDVVHMKCADNMFHLSYRDSSKIRDFKLPTINIEEKNATLPNLSFKAVIVTNSDMLASAIEDIEVVGESATFNATDNKFLIMAEGDLNQAKVEMRKDDLTKITLTDVKEVKSKFSIEYLKKFIQASKLSETVKINLGSNYPLRLDYETENLELSFILAPRVED